MSDSELKAIHNSWINIVRKGFLSYNTLIACLFLFGTGISMELEYFFVCSELFKNEKISFLDKTIEFFCVSSIVLLTIYGFITKMMMMFLDFFQSIWSKEGPYHQYSKFDNFFIHYFVFHFKKKLSKDFLSIYGALMQ